MSIPFLPISLNLTDSKTKLFLSATKQPIKVELKFE